MAQGLTPTDSAFGEAAPWAAATERGVAGIVGGLLVSACLLSLGLREEPSEFGWALYYGLLGGFLAGAYCFADNFRVRGRAETLRRTVRATLWGLPAAAVALIWVPLMIDYSALAALIAASASTVGCWSWRRTAISGLGAVVGSLAAGVGLHIQEPEGVYWLLLSPALSGLLSGMGMALSEHAFRLAWIARPDPQAAARVILIHRNVATVGSSPQCDVPLAADRNVDPVHLRIRLKDGPIAHAAGPTDRFTLNGHEVWEAYVPDGSELVLGGERVTFHHRLPLPPRGTELPHSARQPAGQPASDPPPFTAAPQLWLRVLGASPPRPSWPLQGAGLTLGREVTNNVVLPDPKISRYHARIDPVEGCWLLTDQGSRNGTRLNGLRVVRAGLAPGDLIYVGDCVLAVESEPTPVVRPLENSIQAAE